MGHNTDAGGSGTSPQAMDLQAREDIARIITDVIFRLEQSQRFEEATSLQISFEDALPYEEDLIRLAFWTEQEFCGLNL